MAKDVIVVVQRDALPTDKESLDILLVSTTGEYPVATYRDVDSVEAVYGPDGPCPNSKIVRKATTLLNQGKTTLAESLIDKFKIVSFAPPSATPATTATFNIVFKTGDISIASGANVYVRIGGDDNVVIKVTATSKITTTAELAALLANTTFTKGGKTYVGVLGGTVVMQTTDEDGNVVADSEGTVVTYTATEGGEADTIPEQVNLYYNQALSSAISVDVIAEFTNGTDIISAADNLIDAIETFQSDIDNDWYYLLTDKEEDEYVMALAKFAEASEPTEAELDSGVEDHRKFYMGQTCNKDFVCETARAAVIYADEEYLNEEPDASYTGNVGPFYPENVTWKFKRPQDGNADTSEGTKLITLPVLTEAERNQLLDNHVNYLTEEYKRQYVKDGTCLDGEFIDVVLGGDWIAKRMRDLLYDLLLENANINYGDDGFGFIATAVMQALAEAVDYNIIATDQESKTGIYSITIPKWEDSTDEERRNRIMPDITWEAQLSGAIHQVKTKGVLKVSL